jgi:anti-anti-sigma regulatory factor
MSESSKREVVLPAIVDLDALDSIRDHMIDAIEHGPVSVDGESVERVATNGLLMLLCAAETAQRNKHDFAITNISVPMQSAIERLGLAPNFALLNRG